MYVEHIVDMPQAMSLSEDEKCNQTKNSWRYFVSHVYRHIYRHIYSIHN